MNKMHMRKEYIYRVTFYLVGMIVLALGIFINRSIIGVGIGTIMAMIGVGRTIAVFNHF